MKAEPMHWITFPTHTRRLVLHASLALVLAGCSEGDDIEPEPEPELGCVAITEEVSWFRGPASNAWNDVFVDAKGHIWLAGFADGTLGFTNLQPSGNSRGVVRQLAPDGRLLWDSGTTFDTPGTDVAETLAVSAQGSVVVAGRTTGVLAGTVNAGQFDTFVAQGNPTQSEASWRLLQIGNPAPQQPRQVAVSADGEISIAGYDDIFVRDRAVEAWEDPFVLRVRASADSAIAAPLQLLWQHRFDSPPSDLAWAAEVAADGATYFAYTLNGGPERGTHVRKLDAAGMPLWTRRYTTLGLDSINALQLQPDGSLWIAGTVHGSFEGHPPVGTGDVFLARVASDDGRVLQSWRYGSGSADQLTDMAIDAKGNFLLFGETVGSWVPGQPLAGEADLFLLKLSPTGQRLAARQWGTAGDDAAKRLAVDACGNAVAVGISTAAQRSAGVMWVWRP
jgi:hypothetical protein